MKTLRISVALIVAFALVLSCSPEKKNTEGEASTTDSAVEWKEMDEFHLVMAESFHPYMDSTNLAPAKSMAGEMKDIATRWAQAPLPAKVDNEEMRNRLQKLSADAAAYQELTKSGSDEAIGDALTNLHDLFHEIQDSWYHSGAGEHDGEHSH